MAGSYCQFCGWRCFVLREVVTAGRAGTMHLATCRAGAAHDRKILGVDHTTTRNPVTGKTGGK